MYCVCVVHNKRVSRRSTLFKRINTIWSETSTNYELMIHKQSTMKQSLGQRETFFRRIKLYPISKTNLTQVRTFRFKVYSRNYLLHNYKSAAILLRQSAMKDYNEKLQITSMF